MEKIEEFIKKNREALDRNTPSSTVWRGIRKGMRNMKIVYIRWISAAAMIIVIFTTSILYYYGENHRNSSSLSKDKDALIMKANPQLRETEIYYNNLINDLYSKATPLFTGHPDIEKELTNDLSHIDSLCADLKKDLRDNVANEEVIEAMINNYRIKIRILEDMLDALRQNENKSVKNKDHAL